ncbi:group 2 truncated hemoglobin 3-2 isoform X1 [Nicotiana tomentosiformis]|uniref:group 2 truncated hemoglobin 3-2 isoform X1 n=1 Tax=Nicotiana tomentosiformis TaxID=4098 RepID=UPI00388C72B0
MQSLQEKASERSGVDPNDAFAIDETNLFEKLGLQTFINLSTNFYNRFAWFQKELSPIYFFNMEGSLGATAAYITPPWSAAVLGPCVNGMLCTPATLFFYLLNVVYDDEEEWFRSIFSNSSKEDAIRNQYEFFVQRMGGPPLYSQRKGHPALIGRHRPFPVTHKAAERWLHHMQLALDSATDIDEDSKIKMMNFFRHTAFFLVAGDELKNQNQAVACKHASNKPAAA